MSNKTSHDSDVSFIQALAELLRENDLTELQVKRDYGEKDSLNVRVSRQTQTMVQASVAAPAAGARTAADAPSRRPDPPAGQRPWSAPFIWRPNRVRRLSQALAPQ